MNDANPDQGQNRNSPDQRASLLEALAIYLDAWPTIVAVTALVVATAITYILLATPVYRTNALIQVEEKSSNLGALSDLSSIFTGEMPTEAEIEIVQSRAILGSAIRQRNLEIQVTPNYFPLLGAALARRHQESQLAPPLPGLDRFAWGGESLKVERMEVPRSLVGKEIDLVAGDKQNFSLLYDGRHLVSGRVGEAASGNGVSIFVSELKARPNTGFKLERLSWLEAVSELRKRLSVRELGRKTGILEFSLEGPDPVGISQTLDAIAETYLRQNVERTSEDAARTLEFLETQLPQLKMQLDTAEAALNRYRVQQGSVDLSLETQGLLEQVGEIEKQVSELELKNAELAQRFTAQHPVMQAVDEQRRELLQLRASMDQQIRELPAAEQDSLRLMRDVRVANELYMLLLNRSQELKVVRAGTVGNVRIIDAAVEPLRPVKPDKLRIVGFAFVAGLLAGLFVIAARERLNPMIRDSQDLEKAADLPVYAVIPHSEKEQSLNARQRKAGASGRLLFESAAEDVAIESLRSLRTSLEFLLLDASSSIITVGGPAPGAGKSFVSANLAALFAQSGHSTVLVDGDLRRGHLHRLLGSSREPGLADVITGHSDLDEATRKDVVVGVDFISTGAIPPNPSELVASSRFESLLNDLVGCYELVIIDAPPVLGAAEAMTLARLSGINLLIVRSEQQTPREVELSLNKLRQAGAHVNGFVLNDLAVAARRHAYAGYHYYRYNKLS